MLMEGAVQGTRQRKHTRKICWDVVRQDMNSFVSGCTVSEQIENEDQAHSWLWLTWLHLNIAVKLACVC